MSILLFANNAESALAGGISNTATSCALEAGGGALFPNPGSGEYFVMTFVSQSNPLINEIVWVTARTGDTLTIVRGQEGTSAVAWNAGDFAIMQNTAGTMRALAQLQQAQSQSTNYSTDTGTVNAIIATLSPAPANAAALVGMPIRIRVANATTITNPVVTVNGIAAQTIVNSDGSALLVGQIKADMIIEVVSDGTNMQLMSVTTITPPVVIATACYLSKSGTDLLLSRSGGTSLLIAGVTRTIPSGGVTLSPSGLGANAYRYIYAAWVADAMILIASTTVPVVDTTYGIPVMTGDATRTLVGAAATNSLSAFFDDTSGIGVISYYNRRTKAAWNNPVGDTAVPSGAVTEVTSANRTYFLSWNDESIIASYWNDVKNSQSGNVTNAFIGIDGIAGGNILGGTQLQTYHDTANQYYPITNGVAYKSPTFEGSVHYLTIGGQASADVSTWLGNGGTGTSVMVRG